MEGAGWGVWVLPQRLYGQNCVNITHTVPIDDMHDHDLEDYCWCRPRIDAVANPIIGLTGLSYVHHSADYREHMT